MRAWVGLEQRGFGKRGGLYMHMLKGAGQGTATEQQLMEGLRLALDEYKVAQSLPSCSSFSLTRDRSPLIP